MNKFAFGRDCVFILRRFDGSLFETFGNVTSTGGSDSRGCSGCVAEKVSDYKPCVKFTRESGTVVIHPTFETVGGRLTKVLKRLARMDYGTMAWRGM
jgi:hypothetical protein